jgi:multiple sugar transport system ATP-binding protein
VYENFGDERRISVRVGDELLNITSARDIFYKHGDTIRLEFNSERTHLFDPDTGVCIN